MQPPLPPPELAGLEPSEAARRLTADGPNAWPEPPVPSWGQLLARQLTGFIAGLLMVATLISLALGEHLSAAAILGALLLNAVVGTLMDAAAEQDLRALRALTGPEARVRRGGHELAIPAAQVVRGDLLVLREGDRVAADARLLTGTMELDESLLTGESLPMSRQSPELLHAGTLVVNGSGLARVEATGAASELGRIGAMLTRTARAPSPLAEQLARLGRTLVSLVAVVALVILGIGTWQGQEFLPLLTTALVLAIAAIPEGLSTVATLALASGARHMAQRGLKLRALSALEALGSIDILVLDKTGTLTMHALTLRAVRLPDQLVELDGGAPALSPAMRELLVAAQHCNEATLEPGSSRPHGDAVDGALLLAADQAGLPDPRPGTRREVVPPGPGRPSMRVQVGPITYLKGAPEAVLAETGATGDWLEANRAMAARALRVLAIARAEGERWTVLGLVGLADPPRPGAAQALATARQAGIRPVMLTGDQAGTALAIARELELSGTRPPVLAPAGVPVPEADVHARATPALKLALIEALQAQGHRVAMTGDGVNDAPALRAAVAGVAMGGGTEVAREAASAVLVTERLEVLLAGIAAGRAVFVNIQQAVDYLLTCSLTAMLTVLLTTAAGLPAPLTPLQILYLNLLTHTLPALGLALEPAAPDLMQAPPRSRDASLLPPARLTSLLWHGVLMAVATLALGAWGLRHGGLEHGRTLAFATLASSLLLHTLGDRSPVAFGGWRGRMTGTFLGFLGSAVVLEALALGYPPLRALLGMTSFTPGDALGVGVAAILAAVGVELSKRVLPPGG